MFFILVLSQFALLLTFSSGEWVFPLVQRPGRPVVRYIPYPEQPDCVEQGFPRVAECHRRMVRELPADQYMPVEPRHFRNSEHGDTAER